MKGDRNDPNTFITQVYRRPDGAMRRQRKRVYDLCPLCGEHYKRIGSAKCRFCYESRGTEPVKAMELLAIILDHMDHGMAIHPNHVRRARVILENQAIDVQKIKDYTPCAERKGAKDE